ncbi:hypothetical protein FXO38_07558 [Capsicum annuum]|nr:hypothetical protein FXO38_07558 [Capsicum annuum]KAF3671649.1 hypothetical protein FXO37_07925 [Capsicum annuum]
MADESRFSVDGSNDSVPDNSNDNSVDTTDAKKMKEMESRSTVLEYFEKIFENDKLQTRLRSEGGIMALLGIVRCRHQDLLSQVVQKTGQSSLIKDGALTMVVHNSNKMVLHYLAELGIMTPPTVHPGLFISSVLLGQISHRSEDIWNNGTCDTLTCLRYDGDFWDYISRNPLHERACRYLLDAEFYDLSKVGQYAWGAATLAILYRYLCRTSQKGIRVIGGFYLYFRPQRDPDLLVDEWLISILPGPPRARPYSLDIFATLPDYCMNDSNVWRAIVPEIAWDAVEWHYPDRARTLHQIYRTTLSVQDSDNNELCEFEDRLSKLAMNSFRVAGERGRGRIEDQYPRGDEYVEPRPQPRRRDLESQVDDNGVELESHFDDNGENTLGVGSIRGGRPCGRPPGRSIF